MRPVVIVQHEATVPPGSIAEVLEEEGIDHVVLRAWSGGNYPAAADVRGVVVLGGTMNVDQTDEYPFLEQSLLLVFDALEQRVPILGVCLGSQMMAKVLGQPVYRSHPRNALFSPLKLTAEGTRDPVLEPFADAVPVLQFHEDTYDLPRDAVGLATSAATGRNQAFRYGDFAYGVQFHFEVDDDILHGWCRAIGPQKLEQEWGIAQDDLERQAIEHMATQKAAGKELLLTFLRKVA